MLSRLVSRAMFSNAVELHGPRVLVRPLNSGDFKQWSEVRIRCGDWLTRWEPAPLPGHPDLAADKQAFSRRCAMRDREWNAGVGYGFGIFRDRQFLGEVNINSVQRGPFQNAYVGYWIDCAEAGNGYMPEAVALVLAFAFEEIYLHRVQISVIPRNTASRRVAEKLRLRNEGIAERYLEINGVWEDHVRYGITSEDWRNHRDFYMQRFLGYERA